MLFIGISLGIGFLMLLVVVGGSRAEKEHDAYLRDQRNTMDK